MKKFVFFALLAVFVLSCSRSEGFDKEKYLKEGDLRGVWKLVFDEEK